VNINHIKAVGCESGEIKQYFTNDDFAKRAEGE